MSETDPEPQPTPDPGPAEGAGRKRAWIVLGSVVLLAVVLGMVRQELRTSAVQARLVSEMVEDVGWSVEEGPSDAVVFPTTGPYDERLGYVRLPELVDSLQARGFRVARQARATPAYLRLTRLGLYPLYEEKRAGGLTVLDRDGQVVHQTLYPRLAYASFDSVPDLVWRSLLWIEDRTLLEPGHARRNPAVNWARLSRSVVALARKMAGSSGNVPGGSTLATQIEKFRHSPDGLTRTPADKLRQMATATARAYLDGPGTLDARRRVVRSYLNTVPLAAQRGHGEVVGTAEGLWAWYGTSFDEANDLLRTAGGADDGRLARRAEVYRQALSLLVAHRRPSYYLARPQGRADLAELTDTHLVLLRDAGVVPPDLAAAALEAEIQPLDRAPEREPVPFVERKTAVQLRNHLLGLLEAPSLYDLDRYDAEVETTLDLDWQGEALELFRSLGDPDFVRQSAFGAAGLLDRGDPARVVYTLTLMETTPLGNVVRVQADNFEGPLSLAEAGRIELGSTAKLRTLVSYLQAVAELHGRLTALPADSLAALTVPERDRITRWAVDRIRREPDVGLRALLEAAMQRGYSANPAERFATGGGVQTFNNFDATWDQSTLTVTEAFRHSANLPWVRIMRDVVHYHMYRGPGSAARALDDPDVRRSYLARFADDEGSRFVRQFHRKYAGLEPGAMLEALVRQRDLGPQRLAWAYRTVAPDSAFDAFASFARTHSPGEGLATGSLQAVWDRADPAAQTLADLGYLARVHPLELWVLRRLLADPSAGLDTVLADSREVRQEVYRWLFETRSAGVQNQRIRTVLEIEAFQEILRQWRALGYPYANIVPSYGTAIGSSGDRPQALAELMGILVNDGVRLPVVRVDEVALATDTPYETVLERTPAGGERVLAPEVAAVARDALVDVVERGTARRARGSLVDASGAPLRLGGKTGTGDNRYRIYGPDGGLRETRVVNRTATFVFFAGARHFGVVTAYVQGPEAAGYRFTSGLPSQILRTVGPGLGPVEEAAADSATADR